MLNPQQHQLNMEKHPIARVPTLAAIEEQSITAALTKVEDRPKVTDIFPSQEPSDDPTSEQGIAIALCIFYAFQIKSKQKISINNFYLGLSTCIYH